MSHNKLKNLIVFESMKSLEEIGMLAVFAFFHFISDASHNNISILSAELVSLPVYA